MEWKRVSKWWMWLGGFCLLFIVGGSIASAMAEEDSAADVAGDIAKDFGSAIWLITTVTGLIKTFVPKIPERLVPLVPIILGILYGVFLGGVGEGIEQRLIFGLSFGLNAAGAYRTGKVTTGAAGKTPPAG